MAGKTELIGLLALECLRRNRFEHMVVLNYGVELDDLYRRRSLLRNLREAGGLEVVGGLEIDGGLWRLRHGLGIRCDGISLRWKIENWKSEILKRK